MEILFVLLVVGLGAWWLVTVHNRLHQLREPVKSADATLNASLERKRDLGEEVAQLAERVAFHEATIHSGVASAMIQAAGEVSSSDRPTLVLANLAARFPALRHMEAFTSAQRSAVEIEVKIDRALTERNALAERYNSNLLPFPTNVGASLLGFGEYSYRSESRLRAPGETLTTPSQDTKVRRQQGHDVFRDNLGQQMEDALRRRSR